MNQDDLHRMKAEYERRKSHIPVNKYSLENKAYYEMMVRRMEAVSKICERNQVKISLAKTLEIGCGSGGVLTQFSKIGFSKPNLFGLDYLFTSISEGTEINQNLKLIQADGQAVPFCDNSFDVVAQFTAFSSVLSYNVKQNMAKEMLRVLKPDGAILWYDFIWNPINKNTKGIGKREIYSYFPDCRFDYKRITLASPVMRLLQPLSEMLTLWLEKSVIFNSHYLAIIKKKW